MRGRLVLALLGGLVVLGVMGTTAWYARYHYDPEAGPIDGSKNGLAYGQPIDVGRAISIGITTLHNDGKKPVLVERVRLLGVTGPLELLGVGTRILGGRTFAAEFEFPPLGYDVRPLAEQGILPVPQEFNENTGEPLDGLQLVIGIRATKPGIAAYRAVDVRYRVSGRRYHEVFGNYAHLCAPLADFVDTSQPTYRTLRDCPPKESEGKFEDRVLEWPPASAPKNAASQ